jgi:hypothetical protein
MPVERLRLRRFGPFRAADFELCEGVNVVLGPNSTGKTFAAKALYSVLKGLGPTTRTSATPRELVRDKLAGVFRPDDGNVGRLVQRTQGRSSGSIEVQLDGTTIRTTLASGVRHPVSRLAAEPGGIAALHARIDVPVLFLPSREVLSMFEGFIAAYQSRELSFDETYYDTAVALSAAALRGPRPGLLSRVVARLEHELGGTIRLQGPRFYLRERRGGRLEAHLMAEGLRKVGSIVHLIANGTLRQGGVLIWDEPEANLHPQLAETVVECLGALAEGGVQIIVATHDYLIADAVSRWAQYRDVVERTAPVRFFQLLRDDADDVRVDIADTFVSLPANPLLEAFLAHHDREQQLIARELAPTARSRKG